MADGTYERRGPREAELKRFQRLIAAARGPVDAVSSPRPPVDAVSSPRLPVDATPSSRHFETEDNG